MDSNFDHKFYRNYLDNLEKSITFKNDCISQNTDKDAQNSNYDESIYDCYKLGILNENIGVYDNAKYTKIPDNIRNKKSFSKQFEQVNRRLNKSKDITVCTGLYLFHRA